jgi:hypothetical protein
MNPQVSQLNKDWVVADANKGGALVCKRCGDEYLPSWPINVDDYLALSTSFLERHGECEEKQK